MVEPPPTAPGPVAPAVAPVPRYGLLLHPAEPTTRVTPIEDLYACLARLGLCGEPFTCAGARHYLPGPRFLDLVTFLGCSPSVHLGPPAGTPACESLDRFCHLALRELGGRVAFRRSRLAPLPRCPACRHPFTDWAALVPGPAVAPANTVWTCPRCGASGAAPDLDWRQSAGFGATFVELWGIHPGEAVPGEELLAALAALTGGPWRWFYVAL